MKCKKKSFERTDLSHLWKMVNTVPEGAKAKARRDSRKLLSSTKVNTSDLNKAFMIFVFCG